MVGEDEPSDAARGDAGDRDAPASDATEAEAVPADVDLRVPEDATEEEAAAIAAALGTYLAEERGAAAVAGGRRSWSGRRWTFAGRLGKLTGRAARVPEGAPSDGWSAAGRADRF